MPRIVADVDDLIGMQFCLDIFKQTMLRRLAVFMPDKYALDGYAVFRQYFLQERRGKVAVAHGDDAFAPLLQFFDHIDQIRIADAELFFLIQLRLVRRSRAHAAPFLDDRADLGKARGPARSPRRFFCRTPALFAVVVDAQNVTHGVVHEPCVRHLAQQKRIEHVQRYYLCPFTLPQQRFLLRIDRGFRFRIVQPQALVLPQQPVFAEQPQQIRPREQPKAAMQLIMTLFIPPIFVRDRAVFEYQLPVQLVCYPQLSFLFCLAAWCLICSVLPLPCGVLMRRGVLYGVWRAVACAFFVALRHPRAAFLTAIYVCF